MVYVQNINGLPLMPCSEAKARHLLEEHRAVIVNYTPFTIRLKFVVDDITQPVTLGVDAGYETIGLSATTETKILFEAEVKNRTDVVSLMTERREVRKARRSRLRRRKARFDNRRRTDGWLPPSVEQRVRTHETQSERYAVCYPLRRLSLRSPPSTFRRLTILPSKAQNTRGEGSSDMRMSKRMSENVTTVPASTVTASRRINVSKYTISSIVQMAAQTTLITL